MANLDVVGLGIACVDLLAPVPHLPGRDEVLRLDGIDMQGGGPVATALVALARLGASAAYVGCLAPDTFGGFIKADFERYCVSTEHLRTAEGAAVSPLSVVLVERLTGARSILYHRGTVPEFHLDASQEAAVRSARLLHLDGSHLVAAMPAIAAARAAGVLVSLDGGATERWPDLVHLLPLVDILVVARAFSRNVTGLDDPLAAGPALLAFGPHEVVITDGANGCWYWDRLQHLYCPAFAVPVVDTTGAGDTFHGAYLFAILQGWDARRRLAFASATAALKCTQVGGRRGIPTLPQVMEFLGRQNDL